MWSLPGLHPVNPFALNLSRYVRECYPLITCFKGAQTVFVSVYLWFEAETSSFSKKADLFVFSCALFIAEIKSFFCYFHKI